MKSATQKPPTSPTNLYLSLSPSWKNPVWIAICLMVIVLIGILRIHFVVPDGGRVAHNETIAAFVLLRYVLGVGSLAVLTGLALLRKPWRFNPRARSLIIPWICYGVFVAIAGGLNLDVRLIVDGIWFLTAIPIAVFLAVPNLLREYSMRLVAYGMVLGHLPYLVASLILAPPSISWMYRGILGHGNALGETAATFCVGLLILINAHMFEKHRSARSMVFMGTVLLFGIGIVLLSSSRTSLVSLVLITAILFFRHVRFELTTLRIRIPRMFITLVIFIVLLLGVLVTLQHDLVRFIIDAMINKFVDKASSDNIISNRTDFWIAVISTAQFFGHGTEHIHELGYGAAHSDILQTLDESGFLAALAMIAFMVTSLWHSFWYAMNHRHEPFGLAPFLIILYFWLMVSINNLFGSLGIGITMAMFLAVGTLLVGYQQR
jgi:hypothetical protein